MQSNSRHAVAAGFLGWTLDVFDFFIVVHLNELAPDAERGLMPGLAYQFGILVAAPTNSIEDALRARFGYSWALAGLEIFMMVALTVILLFGRENHGRSFHSGDLLIEKE